MFWTNIMAKKNCKDNTVFDILEAEQQTQQKQNKNQQKSNRTHK